jgi:hypothetical protein
MRAFRTTAVTSCAALAALACVAGFTTSQMAGATTPRGGTPFLKGLGTPTQLASTIPSTGDVNPYGVAVVRSASGMLVKGATLVSNFNSNSGFQGTGKTIVQILPSKKLELFANLSSVASSHRCPGGVGLTTALGILPGGWVVVGSIGDGPKGALPKANPAGCLIVLNHNGKVAAVWSGRTLNGPWDMAVVSTSTSAELYVSDVLARAGTKPGPVAKGSCEVVRLDVALHGAAAPTLTSTTVIGKGFPWKADLSTFVLGPTGIAVSASGVAYVVQTLGNHVTSIPDAATRTTAVVDGTSTLSAGGHLNLPLGAAMAPNGDLLVANGGNGFVVEISPAGKQVAEDQLVHNGAGALFGLAVTPGGTALEFVNDATNALDIARTH